MAPDVIGNLTMDQAMFELDPKGEREISPADRARRKMQKQRETLEAVCERMNWVPSALARQPASRVAGVLKELYPSLSVDEGQLAGAIREFVVQPA